jgi:putative toxin-antitoxin system antitoxin component (TIGR02293 family)
MLMIHATNPERLEDLRREFFDSAASPMKYVEILREGMPWEAFRLVAKALGMSEVTAADVLRIPHRTLARRRGGRLDPSESERVLRLIRLTTRAVEALGSPEKAARWLEAPNGALEGAVPITLVDTDIGTQAAEDVLTRIEYGVFS